MTRVNEPGSAPRANDPCGWNNRSRPTIGGLRGGGRWTRGGRRLFIDDAGRREPCAASAGSEFRVPGYVTTGPHKDDRRPTVFGYGHPASDQGVACRSGREVLGAAVDDNLIAAAVDRRATEDRSEEIFIVRIIIFEYEPDHPDHQVAIQGQDPIGVGNLPGLGVTLVVVDVQVGLVAPHRGE